jgi:phosphoribosylamine--glycine ligase
MRVFILGSGVREAAVYRKLAQSSQFSNLTFFPGNAMVPQKKQGPMPASASFEDLKQFFINEKIDLLFVGPEQPLVDGIVDFFAREMPKLLVFGPSQEAARLEGSKVFSAEVMDELNIPYAKSVVITDQTSLKQALNQLGLPIVLKADGLAAGKGVTIHDNENEAADMATRLLEGEILAGAGKEILAQQFLTGEEASLFALCNGSEAIYLPVGRDYKRAYDADQGPNTGGMGSYCPGGHLSPAHIEFAHQRIVQPVLDKFQYRGILYVGLMVHSSKGDDLSVIEFNVRLGDPETQCILPMLEEDLLPYLSWACGATEQVITVKNPAGIRTIPQKPGCCVNVVVAAKGYPGSYKKELPLNITDPADESVHIIHAGTKYLDSGLVSNGGRVCNVVAQGANQKEARDKVYRYLAENKPNLDADYFFREDIAL